MVPHLSWALVLNTPKLFTKSKTVYWPSSLPSPWLIISLSFSFRRFGCFPKIDYDVFLLKCSLYAEIRLVVDNGHESYGLIDFAATRPAGDYRDDNYNEMLPFDVFSGGAVLTF